MSIVVILAIVVLNTDILHCQDLTNTENVSAQPIEISTNETLVNSAEVNLTPLKKDLSLINITNANNQTNNVFIRLYLIVANGLEKLFKEPKVKQVTRSIGICMVNGAMDVFSHFLPPSLMPLAVSAAGLLISFEPVAMLRERMPVSTYRRAFKKAMSGFLGTFEKYRSTDDDDDDPYLTRRFNRRFMRVVSSGEIETKKNKV